MLRGSGPGRADFVLQTRTPCVFRCAFFVEEQIRRLVGDRRRHEARGPNDATYGCAETIGGSFEAEGVACRLSYCVSTPGIDIATVVVCVLGPEATGFVLR